MLLQYKLLYKKGIFKYSVHAKNIFVFDVLEDFFVGISGSV